METARPGFSEFNPYEAPRAAPGPDDDPAAPVTSVTFRPIAEDHKALVGAVVRGRAAKIGTHLLGVLYILSIVAGSALLYLGLGGEGARPRWAAALAPSILLAWLLGLPGFLVLKARVWRGRDESDPRGDTTVELTPEALVVRHVVGVSMRTWAGIAEVKEHKGAILFLLEDFDPVSRRFVTRNAHVVPLRAFPTPRQAKVFLRTARHWHAAAPR